MNPGVTANLIAGPADTDALGRLGIAPGLISAPAKTASGSSTAASTSSTSSSTPSTKQNFGLGIQTNLDLSTPGDAGVAKAGLLPVLAVLQNIYTKTNTPASTSTTPDADRPVRFPRI